MRFFFHISDGDVLVRDHEGTEFPSHTEAYTEAIQAAREILADRLARGRPFGSQSFQIHDETGALVRTVPFRDAIPPG